MKRIVSVGCAAGLAVVSVCSGSVTGLLPGMPATLAQEEPDGLQATVRSSWYLRRQLETALVLQGADVIDLENGEVARGVDVHVRGDRIVAVGHAPIPSDAEVFDVSGRWIVPGLVDLHAHVIQATSLYPDALGAEETLRVLLDHGITMARCLPLTSEKGLEWSARVATAELLGPTLIPASGIFEKRPQRTSMGFGDADTAREWTQKEALLGTRWIKVYNAMDEDSLSAIVATARRFGMRVCGHAEDVPPGRAAELGMASIEHMVSIPLSCSEAPLPIGSGTSLAQITADRWAGVDDAAAAALIEKFIANGTGWVPTLVVSEAMMQAGHDGGPSPDVVVRAGLDRALGRAAHMAVQMHRRGGWVGTGTDFPIDGVHPGESLHRELELLVERGGATPLEALRMACVDSVGILGLQDLCGAVAPGRIADFLVLQEDPLADVRNLRTIELVVHQGRLHEP